MKTLKENRRASMEMFRQNLGIGQTLLLVGILVAVFLVSAVIGMRIAVRGTVVEMPTLTGMSVDDARRRLEALDLTAVVSAERYDSTMPEGTVIAQVPAPSIGIKADREVQLVVSLGPRINPVPNLKGSTVRTARLVAQQNGYEILSVSEISVPEARIDDVLAQHPEANSGENIGNQIDILVGRQKTPQYIMPDTVGLNLNQVIPFFRQNGFEVARVQYRSRTGARKGTVVRQFPQAGHVLAPEAQINLEVAR